MELEPKTYENFSKTPKWMTNWNDMEYGMLFLGGLFFGILINMVEIIEIYDNLIHKMNFDWFGSDGFDELETIGSKTSTNSSSYFLVDEETTDFTLIPKQPTI